MGPIMEMFRTVLLPKRYQKSCLKVRQKRHPRCWAPNVIPARRALDKWQFGDRNSQNLQKGLPAAAKIDRQPIHGQMTNPKTGQKKYPKTGQKKYPKTGQKKYPKTGQKKYPKTGQKRGEYS